MKVRLSDYIMSNGEINLEAAERAMAMEAMETAQRRQVNRLEKKRQLITIVGNTIVWAAINLLIYMVTGFFYGINSSDALVPGAAMAYRPMWIIFQTVINVLILALILQEALLNLYRR